LRRRRGDHDLERGKRKDEREREEEELTSSSLRAEKNAKKEREKSAKVLVVASSSTLSSKKKKDRLNSLFSTIPSSSIHVIRFPSRPPSPRRSNISLSDRDSQLFLLLPRSIQSLRRRNNRKTPRSQSVNLFLSLSLTHSGISFLPSLRFSSN